MKIYNHNTPAYRLKAPMARNLRNGAYFYSKEICDNILPLIRTERPIVTINDRVSCEDDAIVFIHNNIHPENYDWMADYNNLILVCGVPDTCPKVEHLGKAIYLPLSVDVEYVKQFANQKIYDIAFAGRRSKADGYTFEKGTVYLSGMNRELLLSQMAKFKRIYAVGRCAIEAKILGCEILPYDERFPDPNFWQVIDNKDAARILQEKLDEIDN